MRIGKLVFSQVIDSLPIHAFRRGAARYDGNRYQEDIILSQPIPAHDLRAVLTHRESLRDIEACLRAQKDKLYHKGYGYPGQRFQKHLGRRE